MHKRTTPKIFARATPPRRSVPGKNYIAICPQLKQNSGRIYALTAWVMCIFGINTPSARTSSTFPLKGTMCAPRKKLIIELDGSQHLEQQEYDDERTKYLEARGYRVLRFWNNDVMNNMESVLQVIWRTLNEEKGDESFKS